MTNSATPRPKLSLVKDEQATAAPEQRSRMARFWTWAGFGKVRTPQPARDPNYSSHYLVTMAEAKFGLIERLRFLVSGRLYMVTSTMTHPTVKRSMSKTAFSVLPPRLREPPGSMAD